MLTYNMDVTPESVWKRTTPSEAELAQPYYCTEAGVFYARQHFSTARTSGANISAIVDYLRINYPKFTSGCLLDTRMPFSFILAHPAKSSRQNWLSVLLF